ncbi:MAG: hypothetical protein CM15mP103_00020 [Gammaproteobacteria bacterium]|nr:MAG: hypothetical protein CM15mP103_00020 [Gammaproteobacteria bacterium]
MGELPTSTKPDLADGDQFVCWPIRVRGGQPPGAQKTPPVTIVRERDDFGGLWTLLGPSEFIPEYLREIMNPATT